VTSRLGSGKSLSFFTVYKAAVFGFVRCTYIVISTQNIFAGTIAYTIQSYYMDNVCAKIIESV